MNVNHVKIVYQQTFQPEHNPLITTDRFSKNLTIGDEFGGETRKIISIDINEEKYIIKVELSDGDIVIFPMASIKFYMFNPKD